MKALLVSISLFSSIVSFSQNNDLRGFDNRHLVRNSIFQSGGINTSQLPFTPYSYDTARALNEINNNSFADAFPCISADGLRLYYTSAANSNQLAFTQRANYNSYFSPPVIIPISVYDPSCYWLSKNELDVYICNDSLFFSQRTTTNSPFSTPVYINLIQPYGNVTYRSASLDNAQNRLYVSAFNGNYLGMFEFTRTSPTSFTYVRKLPMPAGYTTYTGQLSKDELSIFVAAEVNFNKSRIYKMSRALPTDSFSINTWQQVQNINDTLKNNIHPSMSDSLDWAAFCRASQNSWNYNDLYIAHKSGIVTPVYDPLNASRNLSVYPNPATSVFTIEYGDEHVNSSLDVYNIQGQKISHMNNIKRQRVTFETLNWSPGIYFLILTKESGTVLSQKLVITGN